MISAAAKDKPHYCFGREREKWSSETDFFLSTIGLVIGYGNLWLFPYNVYWYGRGVGFGIMIVSFFSACYYAVLMAHTVHYLIESMKSDVAWKYCNPEWSSSSCYDLTWNKTACQSMFRSNLTTVTNKTKPLPPSNSTLNCSSSKIYLAASEYWKNMVIGHSSKLGEFGNVKLDLSLMLLLCWVLLFLALVKGMKSFIRVIYFTSTVPFFILCILFACSIIMEGSVKGIKAFFEVELHYFTELEVWYKVVQQVLYTLSIGTGSLITYAGFNEFDWKLFHYAYFLSAFDLVTSLLSGMLVFSLMGHLSYTTGLEFSDFMIQEEIIIFATFPSTIAVMHTSHFWLFLYYFMMFIIACDNVFSYLLTISAVLIDCNAELRKHRTKIFFFSCVIMYLSGLIFVLKGGFTLLTLLDSFVNNYYLTVIALAMVLSIFWGYGLTNILNDTEFMLGFRPNYYWQLCWKFITPAILLCFSVIGFMEYEWNSYMGKSYPKWIVYSVWAFFAVSVIQIPIVACVGLLDNKKGVVFQPNVVWGPFNQQVHIEYITRKKVIESKRTTRNND